MTCVCVCMHAHMQSLAGGLVVLCLPYGSPIEVKSHQPGQQAHLPWSHLVNTFFISLKLKHVLLATQLASKPLGSVCLCSPAGLKVHSIMSGFYTFWGSKVRAYTLPTTPSSPALLKWNLEIQIRMYHKPSPHYRETTKSNRKLALRRLRHQLLWGHK